MGVEGKRRKNLKITALVFSPGWPDDPRASMERHRFRSSSIRRYPAEDREQVVFGVQRQTRK